MRGTDLDRFYGADIMRDRGTAEFGRTCNTLHILPMQPAAVSLNYESQCGDCGLQSHYRHERETGREGGAAEAVRTRAAHCTVTAYGRSSTVPYGDRNCHRRAVL